MSGGTHRRQLRGRVGAWRIGAVAHEVRFSARIPRRLSVCCTAAFRSTRRLAEMQRYDCLTYSPVNISSVTATNPNQPCRRAKTAGAPPLPPHHLLLLNVHLDAGHRGRKALQPPRHARPRRLLPIELCRVGRAIGDRRAALAGRGVAVVSGVAQKPTGMARRERGSQRRPERGPPGWLCCARDAESLHKRLHAYKCRS